VFTAPSEFERNSSEFSSPDTWHVVVNISHPFRFVAEWVYFRRRTIQCRTARRTWRLDVVRDVVTSWHCTWRRDVLSEVTKSYVTSRRSTWRSDVVRDVVPSHLMKSWRRTWQRMKRHDVVRDVVTPYSTERTVRITWKTTGSYDDTPVWRTANKWHGCCIHAAGQLPNRFIASCLATVGFQQFCRKIYPPKISVTFRLVLLDGTV